MRKKYFIKSFQTGLVLKFIFLVLLESALIFGVFMFLARNTITTGYTNSILTLNNSQEFFFTPFVGLCLIISICVSISGLIALMFVSHRVAGPIYRFEKTLKNLKQGDLTSKITLRKDDDCVELRELLEDFILSLNRRVKTIKTDVSELDTLLNQSDAAGNTDKINQTLASLKNEIGYFKVTSKNNDGQ